MKVSGWLALVGLTTLVQVAMAAPPVVLVDPPAKIEEATSKALAPWDLEVRAIRAQAPNESMPGARDAALSLSQEHGARALIWLTQNEDGPALWVYDADNDRVIVRRLAVEAPFNEAEAASVGLSIKTLLMHSQTAPVEERFGAEAGAATPQSAPPMPRAWFFETHISGRHSAADDDSLELRVGLGISRRHRGLDLGGSIALGPGRAVSTPELRGHYSDVTTLAFARYPSQFGSWTVAPFASGALHWTSIDGVLGATNTEVSANRVNPSLGLGAQVTRTFRHLRLGISVESHLFLRSQRYLVGGAPVLDLPNLDLQFGTYIALPIH